MTAEVEIRVDYLQDVISVPVQAVTQHKHQHFVYVKQPDGFHRLPVEVGQSNNRMVEIVSGLHESEAIALDARARGIADFEGEDDYIEEDDEEQIELADSEQPTTDSNDEATIAVAFENPANEDAPADGADAKSSQQQSAIDTPSAEKTDAAEVSPKPTAAAIDDSNEDGAVPESATIDSAPTSTTPAS